MTRDTLADVTVDSAEDFEALLASLVETAHGDGVDVRGAWEFQTAGSTLNWEVKIHELATEFDEEG